MEAQESDLAPDLRRRQPIPQQQKKGTREYFQSIHPRPSHKVLIRWFFVHYHRKITQGQVQKYSHNDTQHSIQSKLNS